MLSSRISVPLSSWRYFVIYVYFLSLWYKWTFFRSLSSRISTSKRPFTCERVLFCGQYFWNLKARMYRVKFGNCFNWIILYSSVYNDPKILQRSPFFRIGDYDIDELHYTLSDPEIANARIKGKPFYPKAISKPFHVYATACCWFLAMSPLKYQIFSKYTRIILRLAVFARQKQQRHRFSKYLVCFQLVCGCDDSLKIKYLAKGEITC